MSEEIRPGDICVVARDIVIDGRLAFSAGQSVVVQKVEPNAARPRFRYVTLSTAVGIRYQLSDADIGKPAPPPAGDSTVGWRRGALFSAGAVALVIAVVVVVAVVMGPAPTAPRTAAPGGAVVCLDPGHGGRDTGARENGVIEKDVNLDIALRARPLLERMGYRVVLTRETDEYVSLDRRCTIANAANASVLVSIHNNSRPPDVEGTTTYCFRDSADGRSLAAFIQKEVVGRIHRPDRGVREGNYHVLREAGMPAALLEGVFLSAPKEAELIKHAEFRQELAEGVATGTDEYMDLHQMTGRASIARSVQSCLTPFRKMQQMGSDPFCCISTGWLP